MNDQPEQSPFEQAFFDYREASRSIAHREEYITEHKAEIEKTEVKLRKDLQTRAEALAEMKRYMTPEGLEALIGAGQAVTP